MRTKTAIQIHKKASRFQSKVKRLQMILGDCWQACVSSTPNVMMENPTCHMASASGCSGAVWA